MQTGRWGIYARRSYQTGRTRFNRETKLEHSRERRISDFQCYDVVDHDDLTVSTVRFHFHLISHSSRR